jgi:hypothetical protein
MEVQTHLLAVAIPRFIQLLVPLLSLSPMAQSGHGVNSGASEGLAIPAPHVTLVGN